MDGCLSLKSRASGLVKMQSVDGGSEKLQGCVDKGRIVVGWENCYSCGQGGHAGWLGWKCAFPLPAQHHLQESGQSSAC